MVVLGEKKEVAVDVGDGMGGLRERSGGGGGGGGGKGKVCWVSVKRWQWRWERGWKGWERGRLMCRGGMARKGGREGRAICANYQEH